MYLFIRGAGKKLDVNFCNVSEALKLHYNSFYRKLYGASCSKSRSKGIGLFAEWKDSIDLYTDCEFCICDNMKLRYQENDHSVNLKFEIGLQRPKEFRE